MKDFRRSLFLETCTDLRARLKPGTSPYRVLRMCLLIRQLIGSDDRLAEIVAEEHNVALPLYRYRHISVPLVLLQPEWWGLDMKAIDPDVKGPSDISKLSPYAIPVAGQKDADPKMFIEWSNWLFYRLYDENFNPLCETSARKFRSAGLAAFSNGIQITVENLIDHISYCMGGIHGVRMKNNKADKATRQFVGQGFLNYKTKKGIRQHDDIFTALQVIGGIVLKGVQPLYNELKGESRIFVIPPT